jgi:hypothetical protein
VIRLSVGATCEADASERAFRIDRKFEKVPLRRPGHTELAAIQL